LTTSTLVPALLPCAINGRPYLIEPTYERITLDVIRQQSDAGDAPGEHSLSPYGLWRRSRETWHHGAGQRFADGKLSNEACFRASKGIDPWVEGQVTLLKRAVLRRASVNTNLALLSTSIDLILADGQQVYQTAGPFNLMTDNQSTFEDGATTGWTAGANTVISAQAAAANTGNYGLRLRSSAAGDTSATTPTGTSGFAVDGNRQHAFWGYKATAVTARTTTFFVDWYDSAGALISSTTIWSSADAVGWANQINRAIWSPATAAYAALRYVVTGNGAANEDHYIDDVYFEARSNVAGDVWTSMVIHGGEAAQTVQSITTNGYYVWAALGSSGIHRVLAGSSAATVNVPAGTFDLVGYANGRLLAGNDNILYEITAPITAPAATALFTHQSADFQWAGISPGRNCIYAFGNSGGTGGNGEIYRIGIEATSTALGAPTFASYLPDGETIHALQFYAGIVILGTGKGVRVGTADAQGNIDYGSLIETPGPVRCLEPQGRYVWFGWSNYDSTSTGLGRIDLGTFTETLVPAWSSDLMATAQGNVLSAVSFAPYNSTDVRRYFAVSGVGVYGEDEIRVPSGTLETGTFRFGTTERKNLRSIEVRHHALDGTVAAELKMDDIAYEVAGTSSTPGSQGPSSSFSVDETGEGAEVRFILSRPTDGRQVTGSTTAGDKTLTISSGTFTAADVGRSIHADPVTVPIPLVTTGVRIASYTGGTTVEMSEPAAATATNVTFVISGPTHAPDLVRWTAKALALPKAPEAFTITIEMRSTIDTTAGDGQPYAMDVPTEVAAIKTLEQNRSVVDFQLGSDTFSVYVLKSQFKGEHWEGPRRRFSEGKLVVVLQSVAE
jgi:hypothetical protein